RGGGLPRRGKSARLLDIVVRPPARFLRDYVLKRGLLLGWRGLLQAFLAAHYTRLKYMKLYVLQNAEPCPRDESAAGGVRQAARGDSAATAPVARRDRGAVRARRPPARPGRPASRAAAANSPPERAALRAHP